MFSWFIHFLFHSFGWVFSGPELEWFDRQNHDSCWGYWGCPDTWMVERGKGRGCWWLSSKLDGLNLKNGLLPVAAYNYSFKLDVWGFGWLDQGINNQWHLPSGNQTWQWKIMENPQFIELFFPLKHLKTSIHFRDFPAIGETPGTPGWTNGTWTTTGHSSIHLCTVRAEGGASCIDGWSGAPPWTGFCGFLWDDFLKVMIVMIVTWDVLQMMIFVSEKQWLYDDFQIFWV